MFNNDDKTRSFLSLMIYNQFKLKTIIQRVNLILKSFGAQEFYQDPKFHSSIFSMTGQEFTNDSIDLIESQFGKRIRSFQVPLIESVFCKIGHDIQTIHLS